MSVGVMNKQWVHSEMTISLF